MKASLLVVLVVAASGAACGNKAKGPPLAPLPPDKVDDEAKAKVEPPKQEPKPRPVPVGPLEVKLPAKAVTVKLVKPGNGRRVAARIAPKAGAKATVELALDFGVTQSVGTESQADIVPTVVLSGNAEITTADKDGAEYALKIEKTDAKETAGNRVPMDKFKEVLASTVGLKISGKVGTTGATGEVTMFLEKQGEASAQVLDLVRLTLPAWPGLPTEAIGVGAKWTATAITKLADRLDVTMVTDYELVSVKGPVWTIKGTTKITGADQMMQGGKITKIIGKGTAEVTLTDGALPTYKTAIEATFTASEADPKAANMASLDFRIQIAGAVTTK
jgi:predicted small lipoprotein YifL